jgi:hypothetical protein
LRKILAEIAERTQIVHLASGQIPLPLLAKNHRQVVSSLLVVWLHSQRGQEFLCGRLGLALGAQGNPQAIVGFRVARHEACRGPKSTKASCFFPWRRRAIASRSRAEVRAPASRVAELRHSALQIALLPKDQPQVEVRVHEVRVELDRLPQFRDGVHPLAVLHQSQRQCQPDGRRIRAELRGATKGLDGLIKLVQVVKFNTQVVPGLGITRSQANREAEFLVVS